jgi:hypothetical protein
MEWLPCRLLCRARLTWKLARAVVSVWRFSVYLSLSRLGLAPNAILTPARRLQARHAFTSYASRKSSNTWRGLRRSLRMLNCRNSSVIAFTRDRTCSFHLSSQVTTMSLFMRAIHLSQALLSSYAAIHSYNAITNLQAYEATSEKLAEWSKEAAKQLAQTRATQTTGALAVCSTA